MRLGQLLVRGGLPGESTMNIPLDGLLLIQLLRSSIQSFPTHHSIPGLHKGPDLQGQEGPELANCGTRGKALLLLISMIPLCSN